MPVTPNIDKHLVEAFKIKVNKTYRVKIFHNKVQKYVNDISFHHTFGETKKGADLLYLNSLIHLSLATNQDSFAQKNHIGSGPQWTITVEKIK